MTTSTEDPDDLGADGPFGVRGALVAVGLVGLAVTALAALFSVGSTLGVFIGALAGTANLWVLAQVVSALFKPTGARLSWGLVALLKFLGLVLGLFLVVRHGFTDPLSLILGYASLPLGIVFAQLGTVRPRGGRTGVVVRPGSGRTIGGESS